MTVAECRLWCEAHPQPPGGEWCCQLTAYRRVAYRCAWTDGHPFAMTTPRPALQLSDSCFEFEYERQSAQPTDVAPLLPANFTPAQCRAWCAAHPPPPSNRTKECCELVEFGEAGRPRECSYTTAEDFSITRR